MTFSQNGSYGHSPAQARAISHGTSDPGLIEYGFDGTEGEFTYVLP